MAGDVLVGHKNSKFKVHQQPSFNTLRDFKQCLAQAILKTFPAKDSNKVTMVVLKEQGLNDLENI